MFNTHPIFLENSGFLELATLLCNKPILWPPSPPMLRPPPPPKCVGVSLPPCSPWLCAGWPPIGGPPMPPLFSPRPPKPTEPGLPPLARFWRLPIPSPDRLPLPYSEFGNCPPAKKNNFNDTGVCQINKFQGIHKPLTASSIYGQV